MNNKNYLYNGDNLDVMSSISNEYRSKVDVIYIDPPFNTGKKMGKYKDNFSSHENWKTFIYPRISAMKDFLSDNGIIFISIGENEFINLKIICDSIFGEKNKIATIHWQCKYTVSNDKSGISNQIEYILVYCKDIKKVKINPDPLKKEYINSNYKNIDNDPRGPWRCGIQLFKDKNKYSYTVTSPSGIKWTKNWNYSESQWYNVLVKENLIYWGRDGKSLPTKKVFLKNNKGTNISNLWLGKDVGFTSDGSKDLKKVLGKTNFLYPKPVSLIKKILKISAKKDSIIMDCFAGSGTTAQAVIEFNKENDSNLNFVLITNNEDNICETITYPRIEKTFQTNKIDLKNFIYKIQPLKE